MRKAVPGYYADDVNVRAAGCSNLSCILALRSVESCLRDAVRQFYLRGTVLSVFFMAFFMMYDAAVTGSDCAHLTQELNKKREANLLTLTDTDIRTLTESDDVKICKLERMLDRQNHGQG